MLGGVSLGEVGRGELSNVLEAGLVCLSSGNGVE